MKEPKVFSRRELFATLLGRGKPTTVAPETPEVPGVPGVLRPTREFSLEDFYRRRRQGDS